MSEPPNETTIDAFYDGMIKVVQPKKGFRAGTDSVLLASALDAGTKGHALEIGCGSGGALFPAAWRCPYLKFTGLEKDPEAVERAMAGLELNDMADRVELVEGDAGELPKAWQNLFDLVFANPPFFQEARTIDPGEGKQAAYLESLPLKDWLNAMLFALRPKGVFLMIHRASELARILSVLEKQAGEIAVLPVRSFAGADAKRVIIRARKGLRPGPMRLLAGLALYDEKGERSELITQIARDGIGVTWR